MKIEEAHEAIKTLNEELNAKKQRTHEVGMLQKEAERKSYELKGKLTILFRELETLRHTRSQLNHVVDAICSELITERDSWYSNVRLCEKSVKKELDCGCHVCGMHSRSHRHLASHNVEVQLLQNEMNTSV